MRLRTLRCYARIEPYKQIKDSWLTTEPWAYTTHIPTCTNTRTHEH